MEHNTYQIRINPNRGLDNRDNFMVNSYRYGIVTAAEAMELRDADEAKAKAKVARTGKPVTIRINVGIYEVFTTSGHYQIEKELVEDGYGQRETGWWILSEWDSDGFLNRHEEIFQTLKLAKEWVKELAA